MLRIPMCYWGLAVPLTVFLTYKAIKWKERWDERPSKIRRELHALNRVRAHRRRCYRAWYGNQMIIPTDRT